MKNALIEFLKDIQKNTKEKLEALGEEPQLPKISKKTIENTDFNHIISKKLEYQQNTAYWRGAHDMINTILQTCEKALEQSNRS